MNKLGQFCGAVALSFAFSFLVLGNALALDSVKIMIPANPGGGWDQTGRNLAKAMTEAGVVKHVQFDNKGGAAGTIGLAQFVNTAKGDGSAILVGGMVMVGGIILNKSQVNLSQVTPLALQAMTWRSTPWRCTWFRLSCGLAACLR